MGKTIVINNIEVPEDTAAEAMREWFLNHPPPKPEQYQFKAADVCKIRDGFVRFIMQLRGKLISFDSSGIWAGSSNQKDFEDMGYRKIGELKDYIK